MAAGIERWNTFAPTLPLALEPDLLWIAVPLAIVALLFLAVFSCGRRSRHLLVVDARPTIAWRSSAPSPRGRRTIRRAERAPHGPRGPTRTGVAALA